MYPIILFLHNLIRWIVLIVAVVAVVRAYLGWLQKREWTGADRRFGVFFASALDTQLLLGIILIVLRGFSTLGTILYEHVIPMILAVVVVHVGSVLSRRAVEAVHKHRRAALWYTLAILIVLVSIPWAQPLIRGF